jgi:hypothetical protein
MTTNADGAANPLPRPMFNAEGQVFDEDIEDLYSALDVLTNEERADYRRVNAEAIASHESPRILIVAGPGSGKSFLFLERIKYWVGQYPDATIGVASFVRKLVSDLSTEVSQRLSEEHQQRVSVSTIHSLARSLVERGKGARGHPRVAHVSIIAERWQTIVWRDVLAFLPTASNKSYTWKALQDCFYTETFPSEDEWTAIFAWYETLQCFYNAVGFADMIYIARLALDDTPSLNAHKFWVIDEYQDLNAAEDHLIRSLTVGASGVLLAGDDEQAIYQEMKRSSPDIITSYYSGSEFANAMLPYCSRCSYFVCLAAASFIATGRIESAIRKIYLPVEVDLSAQRVQIVATAAPSSAVDYVERFMREKDVELSEYLSRVAQGKEHDPFLLILRTNRSLEFLGNSQARLTTLIDKYSALGAQRSADYWSVMDYCTVAQRPEDNFALRKVLAHQELSVEDVHQLLEEALTRGCRLAELEADSVKRALEQSNTVFGIVWASALSTSEKVDALSAVLRITDHNRLVSDLDAGTTIDEGEEAVETADSARPVELLTIVGSKGLSAHHVIVLGCDKLNMSRATRLTFFVAMTRARQSLHLLVSAKAGGGDAPHPFILELPERYCDYLVHTAKGDEALNGRDALRQRFETWAWVAKSSRSQKSKPGAKTKGAVPRSRRAR